MIDPFAFIILALAVYRLTVLIIEDVILEDARNWWWEKFPLDTKLGYLITCPWCLGFWLSLLLTAIYVLVPWVLLVYVVLALSAVVGLIDHWKTK